MMFAATLKHCTRCNASYASTGFDSCTFSGVTVYLCPNCLTGLQRLVFPYIKPSFSTSIKQEQDFHAHGPEVTEVEEKKMTKARLQVFTFMQDGAWHTIEDIQAGIPSLIPPQSVAIYLRSFREKQYGGHTVNRRKQHGKRVFEYQLL